MYDAKEETRLNEIEENYLSGYIKLYRSLRNHWIWNDAEKLKWWLDILLEVNHTGKKVNIGFELIDCKRGQSLKSRLEWAKRWRVDKSTVDRFFSLLKKDKMISTENLKKTIRLTVCKYDSYNDVRSAKQLQSNSDTTPKQLGNSTNNNDNNYNNGEVGDTVQILSYEKQIFEVMRRQLLKTKFSDEFLEREAAMLANKFPNQNVSKMGNLIASWVSKLIPDIQPKKFVN